MQRRQLLRASLGLSASLFAAPRWAFGALSPFTTPNPVRLAAAWSTGRVHRLGVLGIAEGQATVLSQIELPTRAHGLLAEPGGTRLAVARRPGEWLLRWRDDGQVVTRQWIEPQRRFNGHLLLSQDGRRLFSTETDVDTDQSLIGVRDAISLEKIAEWPTHGLDAHQMLLDEQGHLMVANGGVPAPADSGRMKLRGAAMDASLVRLDGRDGELLGLWRLADPRLSPRHLAWGDPDAAGHRTLGIALQAEHDDPATRAAAPVLALFDGRQLQACALPEGVALAGYGGDIAHHAGQWIVSCPRADALGVWQADGRWHGPEAAIAACALAIDSDDLWIGGLSVAAWREPRLASEARFADTALRLDNHWLRLR